MNHEESKLQQQCVAAFRAQFPQYAMLLVHPINEGSQYTRVTGAIHKAEGAVAGVADLLFFMPAVFDAETARITGAPILAYGLAIEFKTDKGKMSQEQKDWARMIRAAGWAYEVVRSYESFQMLINGWLAHVDQTVKNMIAFEYQDMETERAEREKAKFRRVLAKP